MIVQVTGATTSGSVKISGSKNATIPLLCCSLLAKGKVTFKNVPNISDVVDVCNVLKRIGCKIYRFCDCVYIDNTYVKYTPLLFDECIKMRGLYYLIGVYLTLFSKCEIYLPGGCKIGKRPIDVHLQAFEDMGYECTVQDNILKIQRKEVLREVRITLKSKSVGATMNALFAGLAFNTFKIDNVVIEPECADVIYFLKKIGYPIYITNNSIQYKKIPLEFKHIKHKIIPDRIEAASYIILGLLTGDIVVKNVNVSHLDCLLKILMEAGYNIAVNNNDVIVHKSSGKGINIKTSIYPGFPTDMQALIGVLCAVQNDTSSITETIFENRLQIYDDLINSGIKCEINDNQVIIYGGQIDLKKSYKACDLRHGMALIILSSLEESKINIENFEYILRGYDNIYNKMKKIGIKIKNIDI